MQETSPDPSASKAEWRRWFRKRLATIADPTERSVTIRRHLAEYLEKQPPRCIASFSALPDEPSILELISSSPKHHWALPRVVGDDLFFHLVDRLDQLRTGAFGILEPKAELPIVHQKEIEIFLCPGLGFDKRGVRLGRGKGFYDRSLALAKPEALRIGIAFHEQIVEQLIADPHDIPMNLVIS
jgi:5-formyltetrahydrofolate cyclo-ligase